MNEQKNREIVEELFELTTKGDADGVVAHYDEKVIVEYPQSRERIEGRQNILEVYRNFPAGGPSLKLGRVRASGNLAVAEHAGEYPDGSRWSIVSIYEFEGDKIVHETDIFGQPFDAPEWRAQWVKRM